MKHLTLKLLLYTLSIGFSESYAQTKHNFLHYFPDTTLATEIARIRNKNLNDNVTIEDFQNTASLNIRYSNLKNLQGIRYLKNLRYLGCSKNKITELPEEIGKLKKLEILDFTKAYELTKLPITIGNCISLQKMYLSLTRLNYLPKSIGKLKHLQYLYVGPAELTSIPEELGNCTNLIVLDIHSNNIKNLPNTICHLHRLEDLNISYCGLTQLPSNFGQLHNLKKLNLFENNIRLLPKSIKRLNKLEKMNLYNNYHLDDVYFTYLPKQLKLKNVKDWNTY